MCSRRRCHHRKGHSAAVRVASYHCCGGFPIQVPAWVRKPASHPMTSLLCQLAGRSVRADRRGHNRCGYVAKKDVGRGGVLP